MYPAKNCARLFKIRLMGNKENERSFKGSSKNIKSKKSKKSA